MGVGFGGERRAGGVGAVTSLGEGRIHGCGLVFSPELILAVTRRTLHYRYGSINAKVFSETGMIQDFGWIKT